MIKLFYCVTMLFAFFEVAVSQNADILKAEAHLSYNDGDFFTVIEKLNKVIKLTPNDGTAYYYRGLSKMFLGDQNAGCSDLMVAKSFGIKPPTKEFLTFFCDTEKKYEFLKDFFYKKEILIPENGYRPLYTREDTLRGGLRSERAYDVIHYNLELKLEPKKQFISGSNIISFRPTERISRIQVDLFSHYVISNISWNGNNLPFTREYDAVFVTFPEELKIGELQNIVVNYSGKPQKAINPPWMGGFVWKKDKKGNRWDGVACEHLGASSWWPCKDHMSDEADSIKLTFIVPKDYDLISNGIFIGKKEVDNNFTAHTWSIQNPINNYNVTFYMGKFSHFSDSIVNSNGSYPLDYYVLPYNVEKARETFKQAKEVMLVYEQLFGNYPFPEDGYGMIESPYEGMEHQGAIAYGNDYDKKNNPYIHKEYDYIIVHEAAHEWWGNSVSATDMADMWIQEGFATYAELLFMEKRFSHEDYLKETVSKMFQIFNFWPLVDNRGVNENTFASNDVYTKGAVLLHNLRCTMNNDSLFFKLIKDFAVKYKKKIVTSDDFIGMVNEYTGSDYSPFFDKFLKETGLPVLSYSWKKNGKNIELSFKWTEVKDGFVMPFGIKAGNNSFRLVGTTSEQRVVLNNAEHFRFYNMWTGVEGVEKNSFTYYWTRQKEGEN